MFEGGEYESEAIESRFHRHWQSGRWDHVRVGSMIDALNLVQLGVRGGDLCSPCHDGSKLGG